jgi:CRP-like cAMP-binding protein
MDIRSEINTTSNRLLNFLSPDIREILAPGMKRVSMAVRDTLELPNEPIRHIYFPEDGIASVVGVSPAMGPLEVGMIGKEGMTGLMVILGNSQSPLKTFVQVAGSALVIGTEYLRRVMTDSPTVRGVLLMYVQVFLIQTSQTAIANATAVLPQRLARWLLMCEDRLTSKHIPLTHEFLSIMLGVQRSGVTIAMGELEARGLIKGDRGLVHILDRQTLIKLTNGSYGMAEAEYERLFGHDGSSDRSQGVT